MKPHQVFTRDADTSSNVYFSIVMFVLRGCMCFFPENITQQDMKNEQRVWIKNHATIAKFWEWLQGSNIIPLRRQQQRQPVTSNTQQPTKNKLPQKHHPTHKMAAMSIGIPSDFLHLGTSEVEPIYWKNGGLCLHGSVSGKNMWHRTTTDTKTTLAPLGSAKKLGSKVSR